MSAASRSASGRLKRRATVAIERRTEHSGRLLDQPVQQPAFLLQHWRLRRRCLPSKNHFRDLAAAIHAELNAENGREPLIEMPQVHWQRCVELVRQIRRAQLRGWHLAANELLNDLSYAIPSIQHELSAIAERLPRSAAIDRRATMHDIYQDLVALRQEFEELDYDRRGRRLSVVTEPIVLAGVYLGPFEIRLQWAQATRGEACVPRDRQGSSSGREPRQRHASPCHG